MKDKKVIISLTSYGMRVFSVHEVISSLKKQSSEVFKIVLWLDESEYDIDSIPLKLKELQDEKFEIDFCFDMKSYKKLIPSLNKYPEFHIITFDDDIVIPDGVVDSILKEHKKSPDAIIATRARIITKGEGNKVRSYNKWTQVNNKHSMEAKYCLIPIGFGGVFYPVGSLNSAVMQKKKFMDLADNADDIWFKCMGLLNNTKTIVLPREISKDFKVIDDTQENALYLTKNIDDRNLRCFHNILDVFPEISDLVGSSDFEEVKVNSKELEFFLETPRLFDNHDDAVGFFRNTAIEVERDNVNVAFKLMKIAKKIRPHGPQINKRLKKYKTEIENIVK